MDLALLKKMNIYQADAVLQDLIPQAASGESTLVKADISEILKDSGLYDTSKKTVFKSLGVACEDIAAGLHCYKKLKGQ